MKRMDRPYSRRWAALAVLCLSLLIIVMANTSLLVAAPAMTRDLGLSSSDLQWVIDAYTVPYAALMLVMGAIGDKYSRRGALLAGLVVFAAGSVTGSLVHETAGVITARAVMGVGAAMIMPATLSLLSATFPRRERARAITIWTATSGLAIAAGPLLAGWLLESHSWGFTFLINVPVAAVAVVAALVLVPPSRAGGRERLDLIGGLLSVVFLAALVYMIIDGPRFGWGTGAITAAVVAGAGLAAFVWWELRHPRPILDVRRFRDRTFGGANLAVALFFLAAFGSIYYLTQHLQFVLGYGPLSTGVRLLPLAGAVFAGAAVTGVLTPRLGTKVTVVLGMALGTAGILLLTRVGDGSGYGTFLPSLLLLGVAIGLSVSPCTDAIMGAFPEERLGVGGAVNDTSLELGGSLGIAILGSVLADAYRADVTTAIGGRLPAAATKAAEESIGGALTVAEKVAATAGPGRAAPLVHAADHAFAHAVAHTSLVGGLILGAGTVLVALLLPTTRRPDPAAPLPEHALSEEREPSISGATRH
ncbi:MFS transporter [Actinoallomurus iriomotensis]|uniref:MFS transporter n=1 Tax=Actinoallomurus iriomotensis TaxID=478107 RepID=A0A9W6S799_9ACTN|nr:MFS transporter [Actinoallomurus iriomotensis]GLY89861.1 MFS transporter [Actinoallomurus iriomotensis]